MNRLVLAARLIERRALRYTPAGLPVLDFELKHESELSEAGQARKVALQIRAMAIGGITGALAEATLGSDGTFAGFLAAARNGRGLLFHVTAYEPAAHN
ncbi:MAG: primosomal replication protein N [Rubrivivax sp.]|nr:primosomal replication protein N [Rubrivivax sp.]